MSKQSPAPTVAGLEQWPVIAGVAGLHLIGLLFSFWVLAPGSHLTWGTATALLLFLGFWVLLELCLLAGMVVLSEVLASTGRRRWVDWLRALTLALLITLALASLLKLHLTGSHLAAVDLWFVGGSLRQVGGELTGGEIRGGLMLVAVFGITALLLYRGFSRLRGTPTAMTTRSFLLLTALALVGVLTPLLRYPEVRFMAPSVVPELAGLRETPQANPLGVDVEGGEQALLGPPIRPYAPTRSNAAPNVAILMLESIPASVLEDERASVAIPNLLALSEQALTFSRPYAPSVHSDYAQMSILSSLHPRKYPQHDYYRQLDYPRTLIWDLLAPAGWRNGAFSAQNEGWGNMISYLRTPSLELLLHSPDWPAAPRRGRGSETKVFEPTVVGAWQEWLEDGDERPWLAYLNFQATHFPYDIPSGAPRPFQPDDLDFTASFLHYPLDKIPVVRNRYLNALHYTDHYVGEVIRILKQRGDWERTILVVVSDHGEAFYEHGQPTHGTTLHEEQVRSLLMVRIPGVDARRVDEPVSLMDVLPSLADRLGLPAHGNLQGRPDIFEPDYRAGDRPFFFTIQGLTNEDGVLKQDWKYVVNWRTGAESLYHLATDPGELDDLSAAQPDRALELRQELIAFLSRQLAYYSQAGWSAGVYPPPIDPP